MKRILPAAFAALVILASTLFAADDFTKDGHRGELPEGTGESGVGKTFRVDVEPPNPLSCDTKYFFRAVSHQGGVTCEGYNFAGIYRQAAAAAFARAGETQCKSGPESQCKTSQTWRAWHHWDCKNGNADAIVVVAKVCPKTPPVTETPKVDRPNAEELKSPNPVPAATQPGTTEDIDLTGGPPPIGCTPPNIVTKYTYRIAASPKPASMKPYVDEAERFAEAYAATIRCKPPCKEQPFRAVKTAWSYDGTHVVVEVWFIRCKQPD